MITLKKSFFAAAALSCVLITQAQQNPMSVHPADPIAKFIREKSCLGKNILIFRADDNPEEISQAIEEVHTRLFGKEFGTDRYALLFMPGDYTSAGTLNIPFYTHICGLGKTPYEVRISNLWTPPHLTRDNGTCTFWRSAENLSIIGPESYEDEDTFRWAVSQAAPLRRVYSQRVVKHQWNGGWVSGGFTADCHFEAAAGSNSQQQWYTRNSHLAKGRGEMSEACFNYCFEGVTLGAEADTDSYMGSNKRQNVTFLPSTVSMREKPFLYIGTDGRYKVFKPSLRHNSQGTSYTRTDMGNGEEIDLLDNFLIVKDTTDIDLINQALADGRHIFFTPGMYTLPSPIHITRDNSIVMGIGYATLIPGKDNEEGAIVIDDVDGATVCSLLFDAHFSSSNLLLAKGEGKRHNYNPTLLADLFFRIGGFIADTVHVDRAVQIDSHDVIGDHFWIWRADHGVPGSVGWNINTATNGLVVNGDYVTIHGLFNEHFQQYQTLWNGEHGKTVFYQCETPYDAPSQQEYMSENGTRHGYCAYKVSDHVKSHEAHALSIYDVLTNDIRIENALETPVADTDKADPIDGIAIRNLCSTSFSRPGKRGFNHLINGHIESTYTLPRGTVVRFNP